MKRYETFRHEYKRLQAIRLAHLINRDAVTWRKAGTGRNDYDNHLSAVRWAEISPFCLLKAKVLKVYFLNPADLGRWGGEFLPWHIGQYHSSRMIPAEVILTVCSDEDVDGKLRDALCLPPGDTDVGQVEVLSWFGYSPMPQLPANSVDDKLLSGPFHLLGSSCFDELRPLFKYVALVFLQHQSIEILTDIRRFFAGLKNLVLPHDKTEWTPLVCGLLKGNIDGFLLLGRNADPSDGEAEELSAFLADREHRKEQGKERRENGKEAAKKPTFWEKVSPVAVYFGSTAAKDVVAENFHVLARLPLPVTMGDDGS